MDILTIIMITFSYSTCISSFLAAVSLLCSFFKCFFGLVYVIFVQYIAIYRWWCLKCVTVYLARDISRL